MGWAIYESYQRALAYRGAVDYDDLIRLALLVLRADADYLAACVSAGQLSWKTRLKTAARSRSRSCGFWLGRAPCATGYRQLGSRW